MPTGLPSSAHDRRILAVLAAAFFFISQSLALYLNSGLYRQPPPHLLLAALAHYGGMAFFSLLLPRLAERGPKPGLPALLAPLPLLLLGCAAALFCSHVIFAGNNLLAVLLGKSLGMGLFLAAALHVFFLSVREHRGFFLGLAIGAGELIWLVVLPGMSAALPAPSDMALFGYVHKLQAVFQAVTGLLIASALAWRPATAEPGPRNRGKEPPAGRATGAETGLILALLAAGVLLHILYGLALKQPFPKAELRHAFQENLHIALLFSAPLAGLALDRGGAKFLLAGIACVAAISPAALLVWDGTLRLMLHDGFSIGRQVFFLTGLVLAGRLVRGESRRLLLCCLLYVMQSFALVGAKVAGSFSLVLFLAAGVVLSLAFLGRRLAGLPEISAKKGLPDAPEESAARIPAGPAFDAVSAPAAPAEELSGARFLDERQRSSPADLLSGLASRHDRDGGVMAVFARDYGLSEQEEKVMAMLAQGLSTDEIAGGMGCKNATIRTYVHRLFKKTGTSSRRELLAALAARAAGEDGAARPAAQA